MIDPKTFLTGSFGCIFILLDKAAAVFLIFFILKIIGYVYHTGGKFTSTDWSLDTYIYTVIVIFVILKAWKWAPLTSTLRALF